MIIQKIIIAECLVMIDQLKLFFFVYHFLLVYYCKSSLICSSTQEETANGEKHDRTSNCYNNGDDSN
jgi:hypothetical protein